MNGTAGIDQLVVPLLAPSRWRDAGVIVEQASGVRVRFSDGIDTICATSGLWNVPLGAGRPEIAEAVRDALLDASSLSLFRHAHPWALDAADRLLEATGGRYRRVLLTTSGGSANDAVMKVLRQRAALVGRPERGLIAGLIGSYHGLTFGAHALSGDSLAQELYGVDRRGVRHVAPNDVEALERLAAREGDRLAGIVVEPVLGSGAIPLTAEFIDALGRIRRERDVPIVADEVATGFGRTGPLFASESWPFVPDALIVSKALTNGTMAAAAVLLSERLVEPFDRGDAMIVHAETQAGTPAACAAILATLDLLDELTRGFTRLAPALADGLTRLAEHPKVMSVRGVGAMRAIEIAGDDGRPLTPMSVLDTVEEIRRRGAIVHPGPGCLQLFPAAVLSITDLEVVIGIVGSVLNSLTDTTVGETA